MNNLEIIASHKKGNYYGIKLICCIGMLGIYARDMIILVALGRTLHTFPLHANLMIMKPWLLMPMVDMIIMMWKE